MKPVCKAVICTALLCIMMCMASCSTPGNITYFQDADVLNGMVVQPEQQFRLRTGDKINIVVSSSNPMLSQQFCLSTSTASSHILGAAVAPKTLAGGTYSGSQPLAYTVDEQGTINFPVLGKLSVGGRSRQEVAAYSARQRVGRIACQQLALRIVGPVAEREYPFQGLLLRSNLRMATSILPIHCRMDTDVLYSIFRWVYMQSAPLDV